MEKAKKIKSLEGIQRVREVSKRWSVWLLDGLHPFGKRDVGGFLRNHRRI